jgi:cytochrome c oxidase subunit 1
MAVAILGPLTWMQNMYTAPLPLGFDVFAMLVALALVVPIGLLIFNWVATLWGGALRLNGASLFAIAAIAAITLGLSGELAYSIIPVGWQLDNTTAAQQDTILVIVGGVVLGGFAALHYWFPKLTGRTMGNGLARISLGAILVGLTAYCIPMFLAGVKGQPVDIYKYFQGNGLDGYNLVASLGSFLLVIGIFVELANAAYSYSNGVVTGPDPWGGSTLEWFTLSPPPIHNFDAVPDVRSPEPLLDIRRAIRRRTAEWRPPTRAEPPRSPEPAAQPEPAEAGAPAADTSGDETNVPQVEAESSTVATEAPPEADSTAAPESDSGADPAADGGSSVS